MLSYFVLVFLELRDREFAQLLYTLASLAQYVAIWSSRQTPACVPHFLQ